MFELAVETDWQHFLFISDARCFRQRDILQEEVRVARSLIGGRESDVLGVRSENDKVRSHNLNFKCISCAFGNGWREISFHSVDGARFSVTMYVSSDFRSFPKSSCSLYS